MQTLVTELFPLNKSALVISPFRVSAAHSYTIMVVVV